MIATELAHDVTAITGPPLHRPVKPLRDLLNRIVDEQFGGVQRRLANSLGMSESRLGKILKGDHSMSVENCLQLARLTGEPPSRVLAAAGKEEIARLIELLYGEEGRPVPERLSATERILLTSWHRLSSAERKAVRQILTSIARDDD